MQKARKRAFTMLGRKGLSRRELIDRLVQKNHDEAIAERVADEFERDGWIDDAALARDIIEFERQRQPAAEPLLREKLHSRCIAADIIDRVLHETGRREDPADAAMQLAEQRYRSMRSLPAPTAARRIAGALHRRGFDDDTIETVLNRMNLADP